MNTRTANKTMTGSFEDVDQARAARKYMVANGIPQEKIFIDDDRMEIKVIIPEEQTPQIREVFGNHDISPMQ